MPYKPIPARLFTDPSTQVEFRRVYDDNESRMAEVRRLRKQMGCQCCVYSEMVADVLYCRQLEKPCDRTCRDFWVNV